jgi:hypothetical protein
MGSTLLTSKCSYRGERNSRRGGLLQFGDEYCAYARAAPKLHYQRSHTCKKLEPISKVSSSRGQRDRERDKEDEQTNKPEMYPPRYIEDFL